MKHIRRFLESNESHLDLLEYFLDLEDKYEVNLRPPSWVSSVSGDYSIGIYFNYDNFVKKGYESKKVILDIWNCISMVKSIGEFTTSGFSGGDDYAEIKWGFEIPYSDDASYNSSRQNRLMDSGLRWRSCSIGDKEFSDYNNLLSKVRSVTKSYLKSTIHGPLSKRGRPDFQRLLNIGDIEYIEGDFGDDLIVNNFYIRFKKKIRR